MANKERLFVALYTRQGISADPSQRALFQYASYHWAIYVEAKHNKGTGQSFDVTYTDHYTNIPGSGGWRYRYGERVSTVNSRSILGLLMIGKLPPGITATQVDDLLGSIPLPLDGQDPVQNCVSWTNQAILALQQQAWAEQFDVKIFMDRALAQADRWLTEAGGSNLPKANYTRRKFP